MITKIRGYFLYRKQVKALKRYAVATIVDFIQGKEDYLNAIRKIVSSLKDVENIEEIQKMFMHELAEIVHDANEKDKSGSNTESDAELKGQE